MGYPIDGMDGPTPTVFVVDDNASVRRSLRWLIESAGLEVETFALARTFLDVYDPARPGCLVTDVRIRRRLLQNGIDSLVMKNP